MEIFSNINKRVFLSVTVSVVFLLVASFGVGIKSSNAMLHGFGGKIVYVHYCPCSANLAVFVLGVKGGVYTFQPGVSLLFANYQIWRSGPWVVGTYVPGGVCLTWKKCAGFSTTGTILTVGTSW